MSKPRAKAKIASVKEIAAMDFTAWQHSEGEWTPPSNDEWLEIGKTKLPSLRIGWFILYKSKPELIKMIEGLDDETYFTMCNAVRDLAAFLEGCSTIAKAAEVRLLGASCASISRKTKRARA
jgi:hypothetical protein